VERFAQGNYDTDGVLYEMDIGQEKLMAINTSVAFIEENVTNFLKPVSTRCCNVLTKRRCREYGAMLCTDPIRGYMI
jgi:hypothetical protein